MGTLLRRTLSTLLAANLLAGPAGCLSSSYRIGHDELLRLASQPPEVRWQGVRATQRMLASDTPPEQRVTVADVQPPMVAYPSVWWVNGTSVSTPSHWYGGQNRPASWGSSVGSVANVATRGGSGGGGSGGHSGGGGSGGGGGGNGAAIVVVVVVVLAGVMVLVLAGTEGMRYDGQIAVHPHEVVYLDDGAGNLFAVPLSALTPEMAARANDAVIYEGPEDRYQRLGRAPLNRVGGTVSFGVGGALVHGSDASQTGVGFAARSFFGGFPVQQLGLGLTADLASGIGNFSANVGGEVQAMPITYVGGYLGAGWSWSQVPSPTRDLSGWYVRAGVQGELPMTTRLTAQLRAGGGRYDYGQDYGAVWVPELSLGLAVY